MTRTERLAARLRTLAPTHLELHDDSARHAGHAGAAGGAGHFDVLIVAAAFADLAAVARHRAVYAAVGDLIPGEVHALSIRAYTPDEWARVG
jgi:BolA protein